MFKRLNLVCSCGARWAGSLPAPMADAFEVQWRQLHTGEGHGVATPKQASRARTAAEEAAMKEQQ